jgi:hypothetical protein
MNVPITHISSFLFFIKSSNPLKIESTTIRAIVITPTPAMEIDEMILKEKEKEEKSL